MAGISRIRASILSPPIGHQIEKFFGAHGIRTDYLPAETLALGPYDPWPAGFSDLAAHLGVTPQHLAQAGREQGKTPEELLRQANARPDPPDDSP